MPDVPRLVPEIPFPAYTYVPGQKPHPVSDPAGHSHGRKPELVAALEPGEWQRHPIYKFGIDLFNHGYYWEAHETWESVWHACGRTGVAADFLKALIKLAAAGVKHLEGRPNGVTSHARRAAELLRGVEGRLTAGKDVFGLPTSSLIDVAEQVGRNGWPTSAPILLPVSGSD
jgi:hypothetical protein